MELVPSCQFYLDSFLQSPFSKFRCTRLHLFRYYNSSSSLVQVLRKCGSFEKPSCRNGRKVSALASSDQFPAWSKPIKGSHPKPPRAVFDSDEDGGDGRDRTIEEEEMMPNEKPRKEERVGETKNRTTLAESTLPASELKRMRNLTYKTKSRVKVRNGKVTKEVLSDIRDKWKNSEIVRVKVDGVLALSMKQVHQILERKTGGLVVLRSGTTIGLYRGVNYEVPSVLRDKKISGRNEIAAESSLPADTIRTLRGPATVYSADEICDPNLDSENTAGEGGSSTAIEKKKEHKKSHSEIHYKDEIDKLLDGLGPRYMDWSGYKPLPVDADLLPGLVPGFRPPFRQLPFGVKPGLSQKDATSLRRTSRFLTPHFALGRSTQLQGLATAMVKLWEKSLVAKIALKRGVPISTSERMAEDLKKLTGGTLLIQNREFFVFYRGKSFLSPDVSEVLMEKERLGKTLQDEEEQARLRASAFVYTKH